MHAIINMNVNYDSKVFFKIGNSDSLSTCSPAQAMKRDTNEALVV